MVAEQLPDNSELRVDVLLEGIESYRGIDVQRGFRLTFFHSTIGSGAGSTAQATVRAAEEAATAPKPLPISNTAHLLVSHWICKGAQQMA
jgi:hypothetical protein